MRCCVKPTIEQKEIDKKKSRITSGSRNYLLEVLLLFDRADAAICLVVLLVARLFKALAALEAILSCVLTEFFVAIFNQQPMGFYNLETLKEDAWRHGITVLNPDINKSDPKCLIEPLPCNFLSPPGERIKGEGEHWIKPKFSPSPRIKYGAGS